MKVIATKPILLDFINGEVRNISEDEMARMVREQEQRGVIAYASGSAPPKPKP